MRTLFAIVLILGLLAVGAFAQPKITQVQNAASNSLPPLPNSAIAPGSYFSIYGSGIGPSTGTYWSPYPLPTSLGGVTAITVSMGGSTYQAYPEFVYSSQINAVLPSTVPPGNGTITVTYNGATSNAYSITVAPMSFGTFSVNVAGTGPGIFTNAVTYALVTPFSTVKPGDYVTIWGTGLGALPDPSTEQTQAPPATNICATTCPVTVWIGGVQAQVTYAGRSGYTAEDQIDFIVPNNPGSVQGCYVQVAVETTSGSSSIVGNSTSLSVDPTGPTCKDGDGIDYGTLSSAVASKGSVNVGAISLLSNYLTIPVLGLSWDNDTVTGGIGTFSSYVLEAFQGFQLAPSSENCTVQPFLQYPPPHDPAGAYVNYLDAGASLSITGPNGTKPVPQDCGSTTTTTGCGTSGKGYSGLVGGSTIQQLVTNPTPPAPFFLTDSGWNTNGYTYAVAPGNYTVSGTGGSAVGALSAEINVSSAAASFKWTNQTTLAANAISRSNPLQITWTGGDPNGYVDITAIGSTETGTFPAAGDPGVLIECFAPASAGSFSIPPYVLAALPSTVGNTSSLVPPGELLVGPASAVTSATPPSGLDALYIFYHYIQGSVVAWQ